MALMLPVWMDKKLVSKLDEPSSPGSGMLMSALPFNVAEGLEFGPSAVRFRIRPFQAAMRRLMVVFCGATVVSLTAPLMVLRETVKCRY